MSEKLIFANVFTLGIIALSLLLLAGSAGAAPEGSDSKRTATGDLILAPDKIYLDPWYSGNSQDCARNMTLLKEGYMLSLDSLNFTSIQAKDGMWGKTIWIANFSLYKNGEVVKKAYLTHGDIIKEINLTYGNIFYYNKTIDSKEYTIIEAKLDAIFVTESCGTVLVILRPFYQYSDVTEGGRQEIPSSTADGGSPYEEWNMTFRGAGNASADSVQQTADGGYIFAGATSNQSQYDWLVKTDSWGNEQWNRTFRDTYGAKSVLQTADGGYIFVGSSLIKTEAGGNEQWNRTFDGRGTFKSVQETTDGGYIISGGNTNLSKNSPEMWIAKTDTEGNEQWNRTFPGGKIDFANSVQQTSDGGYIVAGSIYGAQGPAAWIIKTDTYGNQQWSKTFLGKGCPEAPVPPAKPVPPVKGSTMANAIQQTSDGGYIIAGYIEVYTNCNGEVLLRDSEVLLIKTDENGSEQWNKTFGGDIEAEAFTVLQIARGGYIISGSKCSINAERCDEWLGSKCIRGAVQCDAWLIRTDPNGSELWNKTFGGTEDEKAYQVQQTRDGGYILAGYKSSNGGDGSAAWMLKVSGELERTANAQAKDRNETSNKTQTAVSETTGRYRKTAAGFEAILAITILLTVYITGRRRW